MTTGRAFVRAKHGFGALLYLRQHRSRDTHACPKTTEDDTLFTDSVGGVNGILIFQTVHRGPINHSFLAIVIDLLEHLPNVTSSQITSIAVLVGDLIGIQCEVQG